MVDIWPLSMFLSFDTKQWRLISTFGTSGQVKQVVEACDTRDEILDFFLYKKHKQQTVSHHPDQSHDLPNRQPVEVATVAIRMLNLSKQRRGWAARSHGGTWTWEETRMKQQWNTKWVETTRTEGFLIRAYCSGWVGRSEQKNDSCVWMLILFSRADLLPILWWSCCQHWETK